MDAAHLENVWKKKEILRYIYRRWWSNIINSIKDNDRVLEIGCGNGFFCEYLKKHKKIKYVGVDVSRDNIYFARKKGKYFIIADAEKLPIKSSHIDVVVGIDILHHVNFTKVIKEVSRALKNKGYFLIIEPNKTLLNTFLTKIFGFHEDYTEYPSVNNIKRELKINGFDIISIDVRDSLIYPLSGGFSRRNFIPKSLFVFLNFMDEKFLSRFKFLCWKYIIKAQKVDKNE